MADISAMPLTALSLKSKFLLSTLLNAIECIPTEDGYSRDWRGVADLFEFSGESIAAIASYIDPISFILDVVTHKNPKCVLKDLQVILEKLERWDVIDVAQPAFEKDAQKYYKRTKRIYTSADILDNYVKNKILTVDDLYRVKAGLPLQHYDAFLIFADEDADFVQRVVENLEQKHKLKLCIKNRDLLTSISFEQTVKMKLISERFKRLIVILSPNFLKSTANEFVLNYAQAIGIEQHLRKIIPSLYEKCEVPVKLKNTSLLVYSEPKINKDFWKILKDSIKTVSNNTLKSEPTNTKSKKIKQIETSEISSVPTLLQNLNVGATSSKETPKQKSKFFWRIRQKNKPVQTTNLSDDTQNDLITRLSSLKGLSCLKNSSISTQHTSAKQKKTRGV